MGAITGRPSGTAPLLYVGMTRSITAIVWTKYLQAALLTVFPSYASPIAAAGGAGSAMANWIVDGDPGLDLWPFDVRRFGVPQTVPVAFAVWRPRRLRSPEISLRRCLSSVPSIRS